MCTASHNPKPYTGAKLVKRGAIALSGDAGIGDVRARSRTGLGDPPGGGSVEEVSIYEEFQEAALRFIDPAAVSLKVVVDGGNGMAGPMVGPLLERLGLDLIETYWRPDGNFPDHEPNPLLPENREFIMREVVSEGADLGIAWDGDADRCFFIDDSGRVRRRRLPDRAARRLDARASSPARRSSTTCGPAAPSPTRSARRRHGADEPRRPRVLQDPDARRGRDLRRRGLGPLLLPRLLLRRLGHDPGAADPRAALASRARVSPSCSSPTARGTSSRARSTRRSPTRRRRSRSSPRATPTRSRAASTGSRSTTTTGTSTCARRTPSRCCACAWNRCARARTWSAGATRCSA